MKIKAYAVKQQGGKAEPFSYERSLTKNDVLVKITHCGIATGDVQLINNDWGDTKFPLVPGHEIVGEVINTGSNVTGLKVGDRVGIGYQQEACFECEFCKDGEEQFCMKQKVIGVDSYGGLADHIVIDNRFAFKLPPNLDSSRSVPLLSSGLTVYSAIVKGGLPEHATVAVLGIGGLGQLAIQCLQKMRHTVSAFSHSPNKKGMIESLGARYVDSSNADDLAEHQKKYDFILSTLNVDFDVNTYLKMLKPKGKLCLVAQPLQKLSVSAGLLYDCVQRTIYGSYTGSRKDMINMLAFSANHKIQSMVNVLPFYKMNEVIENVRIGNVSTRLILENLHEDRFVQGFKD